MQMVRNITYKPMGSKIPRRERDKI